MISIKIYRGTHQIGGCCTEIKANGKRLLIDFGANLPGADENAYMKDKELINRVFENEMADVVLFSHYHGDHYGLYKQIPEGIPMYIGSLAKEILQIVTPYIDYNSETKGIGVINKMITYRAGEDIGIFPDIKIIPLYVDHSALDAYMFYFEIQGKKILFTGDFRDHGIVGEKDRVWRTLEKFVPQNIDLLITEGTMLSRKEAHADMVRTEEDLGKKAKEIFKNKKYNFVLVSSTNLDSIMEFYYAVPEGMPFVCDLYQATVMLCAMAGMEKKRVFQKYQASDSHPVIYVLGREDKRWEKVHQIGAALRKKIKIKTITSEQMYRNGFVMLVRKNSHLEQKESVFDKMLNSYYPLGGQIIYSMWKGYLNGKHADRAIQAFIGGRPVIQLHTSGHAYVETIVKLIQKVNPKVIIPMHTECADDFVKIKEFAGYKERIRVLQDEEELILGK